MFINVPYVRLSIRRFTLVPREIMILTYASCRIAEGLSGLTTLRIAETTIGPLDTLTEYIIVNVASCVIGAHAGRPNGSDVYDRRRATAARASRGALLYVIPRTRASLCPVRYSAAIVVAQSRAIRRQRESLRAIPPARGLPCFPRISSIYSPRLNSETSISRWNERRNELAYLFVNSRLAFDTNAPSIVSPLPWMGLRNTA